MDYVYSVVDSIDGAHEKFLESAMRSLEEVADFGWGDSRRDFDIFQSSAVGPIEVLPSGSNPEGKFFLSAKDDRKEIIQFLSGFLGVDPSSIKIEANGYVYNFFSDRVDYRQEEVELE